MKEGAFGALFFVWAGLSGGSAQFGKDTQRAGYKSVTSNVR